MTQFEICDVSKLELTENSNFIKIVLKPKNIIHCNEFEFVAIKHLLLSMLL